MSEGRCVRVLIADDRVRSREGLRALLATSAGVEVVAEAINGQDAVRLAEKWLPDVVLMDVRMPVMDGLEATRQIKLRFPRTRVVLLTMYDLGEAKANAAGADALLVKGCASQDLLRSLGEESEPE